MRCCVPQSPESREEEGHEVRSITEATFHILLALSDQPRHGLGIADEVEERTSGAVRLGPGVLYTTLKKLVDGGLIAETATRPSPEADDPRRRYYALSERGREVLEREALKWAEAVAVAREKSVILGAVR
jgi:DNA-binding PadR family transcriptional regulator